MCLIAYQPAGDAPFSEDVLRNGWSANHHGAGYMFAAGGVLHIRKAFYTLRELREAYIADHAAHGAESAFVMHFRWATHGGRGETNVHPHALADGEVGLVHNGILWDFDWDKADSDTVTFCKTVLVCRAADNLMSPELGAVLAEMIGTANKFVLMANDGRVSIINSDSGKWDGERWYSNDGYLPAKAQPQAQQWSWLGAAPGPVERGIVLAKTDDVPRTALPVQLNGYRAVGMGGELFGDDECWRDACADESDERYCSVDDELEYLREALADAEAAGNDGEAEEIEILITDLEAERDKWGQAELEYGIR